jgi:hypothetical protein
LGTAHMLASTRSGQAIAFNARFARSLRACKPAHRIGGAKSFSTVCVAFHEVIESKNDKNIPAQATHAEQVSTRPHPPTCKPSPRLARALECGTACMWVRHGSVRIARGLGWHLTCVTPHTMPELADRRQSWCQASRSRRPREPNAVHTTK